jgi:hypothetical protein
MRTELGPIDPTSHSKNIADDPSSSGEEKISFLSEEARASLVWGGQKLPKENIQVLKDPQDPASLKALKMQEYSLGTPIKEYADKLTSMFDRGNGKKELLETFKTLPEEKKPKLLRAMMSNEMHDPDAAIQLLSLVKQPFKNLLAIHYMQESLRYVKFGNIEKITHSLVKKTPISQEALMDADTPLCLKTEQSLYQFASAAGEGVCVRCEEARKYNAENPNPYPYYEDYLKASSQQQTPPTVASSTSPSSK